MSLEWWKQLQDESEGKDNKGIFPASVDLTKRIFILWDSISRRARASCLRPSSMEEPLHDITIEKETGSGRLNHLARERPWILSINAL